MKKILTVLFIILILLISGCAQQEIQKKPIKISLNLWAGYAHAFIAKEKGFFEKNGVEVELVFNQDYQPSKELYLNGEVDGLFEVYADTIMHNSEGIPTKVVYIADYSASGDAIVGKSEIGSCKNLKGKKIGVDGINSFSHAFVLTSLEKLGLSEIEVQFENVPALDILDSLEKSMIDAGHTWEPTKSAALDKGYKVLCDASNVPGLITDVLVFNTKIIEERPEDIQAIVKSLFEAKDFLDNNRDEALQIMAEAEGMTKEEMDTGLQGIHMLSLEENIKDMTEEEEEASLYKNGNMISQFYFNRGQLQVLPNINSFIEPKFVRNTRL